MIRIPQPAMALNAEDVPGADYHMWNTWRVESTCPPSHTLGWAATVAKGAPGGKLKALVMNCHGGNAYLWMGTGIGWPQIPLFSRLAGLVVEIYIVACEVVSFTGRGDGNLFCGAIAKTTGASVYASNHQQRGWRFLPFGIIDGYEGKVWKWYPDGTNVLTNL